MMQILGHIATLRYLIPSLITMGSIACAVKAMTSPDPLRDAPWWILTSVLLDKLDGTTARLLRAQTRIGLQLDSFADLIAFGAAPAVVMVRICKRQVPPLFGDLTFVIAVTVALFYAFSTYRRLRRFNREAGTKQANVFRGMPSTLSGAIFGTYVLAFGTRGKLFLILLPFMMIAQGILMNLEYRGWKPHPAPRKDLLVLQGLLVIFIYWAIAFRKFPELLFAILAIMYAMSMGWLPEEEATSTIEEEEEKSEGAAEPGE